MPQKYLDDPKPIKPERTLEPYQPGATVKDIAREARSLKMWVYDPSTKSWYNPDEFEKKYGSISQGFEKFISQVQVRDPLDGVKAGYQKMLDLQIKHEDFTKRVIDYYKTMR